MALDDRDRRRGAVLLHHLAGTAFRHDRAAGRRAEHHRPGRLRSGSRRLSRPPRPRPTLILASTRDFFDIQGTWTTFREAKRTFGILGHPERVDIIEANEEHGYPKPHREAMARWMRRWLLEKDDALTERDVAVCTDAELLCTESGQVLADLRGQVGLRPQRRT